MDTYHILSRDNCVWCERAKELLTQHGLPFVDERIETDAQKQDFIARGFMTVPQIFCNGWHIGGYQQLAEKLGAV